jgi:hypothetical protein
MKILLPYKIYSAFAAQRYGEAQVSVRADTVSDVVDGSKKGPSYRSLECHDVYLGFERNGS